MTHILYVFYQFLFYVIYTNYYTKYFFFINTDSFNINCIQSKRIQTVNGILSNILYLNDESCISLFLVIVLACVIIVKERKK